MLPSGLAVVVLSFLVSQPAFVLGGQTKAATEENPMRRIITMLQDMQKEVEREGEAEKEIFEKALCACEGGEEELDKTIADSQAGIEEWTAKTESGKAQSAQLTSEVADHKTAAAQAKSDLSEATMLREKEQKQFTADEADTKQNLDGLSKAIPAIEKGMAGASLMQLAGSERKMEKLRRFVEVTKYIDNDARSEVLAFMEEGQSESTQGAGEILGILKSMKDEMEKDLGELQTENTHAHESFNDLKAAKTQEISINEKSVIEKEKRIGAIALELSEGTHALEDAKDELANAQKFKATMKEQCASMEEQKAAREKARAEEIKAISEAVVILNDDEALETFSKTAFVQKPARVTFDALLQLTHTIRVAQRHQPQHVALIALSQKLLPHHADADAPPAEKLVVHMIDEMVAVMHDEDVGDEHKKAWCTNETEVSHGIEAEKQDLIEKTSSEISEQEDQIATTVAEMKALTTKIADLDKLVHETTEDRKAQHQEFVDMFATSTTAIRLVRKAITRLEKFYSPEKYAKEKKAVKDAALAKAGLGLLQKKGQNRADALLVQRKVASLLPGGFDAFIQERAETTTLSKFRLAIRDGVDPIVLPETPKGAHEKQESGGVIALMTEFMNDLKMEMTEAETSEKFNAKEYVRIMTEAQETRAQDVKSLNEKTSVKATLDEKLVANKALLKLSEEELHNLELYLVELHTECDFLVRNFEIRHENRIDGETGLEEAETIVTHAEMPDHREIEGRFDDEKTDDHVDEHFPDTSVDDGKDKPLLLSMAKTM
jgi:hypothetical protein